jgi:hypothetical protein
VVSTAIIVERQEDGHAYPVQRPVYFVSEVLSESKACYQPVQKLLYAVLITSRKLRHYFQDYSISVVTDYPLGGAGIQMREDAVEQYLLYKLIDSNQDWKSKWFYITNHHPELPKPSGKQPKHQPWWNTKPTVQEGIQLFELLQKIRALREAGLRAEHVAFSFMKRRVQPLVVRDTLGY